MKANVCKRTFSVDEIAECLGISRPSAYELVHSAGFPVISVGRRLLIPVAAFDRWLEQQAGQNNGR